jgi:YgiT-type zinc finger domain-containing protein
LVSEVFDIDGKPVRVENIPAMVCAHCGEPVFSRDTTEKVRRMVHGEAKPIKSVQMDVFAFN